MTEPVADAADPDLESATEVAKALAAHSADADADNLEWDDLDVATQADLIELGRVAIRTFTTWLSQNDCRIVPPGVALAPQSDAEAVAMMAAIQTYEAAKRRKPRLLGAAAPRLLAPGRLNGKAH